jgi:hypothetical protein
MDIKELQDFFSKTSAEVAIDFCESNSQECKLDVTISIGNEEFMKMGYDLSFNEAEGFIEELQKQINNLRG